MNAFSKRQVASSVGGFFAGVAGAGLIDVQPLYTASAGLGLAALTAGGGGMYAIQYVRHRQRLASAARLPLPPGTLGDAVQNAVLALSEDKPRNNIVLDRYMLKLVVAEGGVKRDVALAWQIEGRADWRHVTWPLQFLVRGEDPPRDLRRLRSKVLLTLNGQQTGSSLSIRHEEGDGVLLEIQPRSAILLANGTFELWVEMTWPAVLDADGDVFVISPARVGSGRPDVLLTVTAASDKETFGCQAIGVDSRGRVWWPSVYSAPARGHELRPADDADDGIKIKGSRAVILALSPITSIEEG